MEVNGHSEQGSSFRDADDLSRATYLEPRSGPSLTQN
jgi:hypothetical protein